MFLVNSGALEGRIDPNFYKVNFLEIINKIAKNNFKKLSDLVNFSNETWNGKDFFSSDEFPYIEISEVDTQTGEIKNINFIPIKEAPSRAKMITRDNDIIISTTRPNRGAISFVKQNDIKISSTGFAILRNLKTNEILKEYLFYALRQNFSLSQMEQRSSGGNYPAITSEELKNILIPIPPIETQQKIVSIFSLAYENKKAKEAEAKRLLEGIDGYLLEMLGISIDLPSLKDLASLKTFFVPFSQVQGNRFDPFYHKEEFADLEKALESGKYDIAKFNSIIDVITKGETPTENYLEVGIPFLRVQNIEIEGLKGDFMFISDETHKSMKRSQLFGGEVLYTMAGSIGIATIFPKNLGEANINQAIAKIILKSLTTISKIFIIEMLNSKICKQQAERFLTVSAQPNINFEQIKSIKIPLPPLSIQEEIASHITQIRTQAKQLESEAKQEIAKAKQEIERMILG